MGPCAGKTRHSIRTCNNNSVQINPLPPTILSPEKEKPKDDYTVLKRRAATYLEQLEYSTSDPYCCLTKKWIAQLKIFTFDPCKLPPAINTDMLDSPDLNDSKLVVISHSLWKDLISDFAWKYRIIRIDKGKFSIIENTTPILKPNQNTAIKSNSFLKRPGETTIASSDYISPQDPCKRKDLNNFFTSQKKTPDIASEDSRTNRSSNS